MQTKKPPLPKITVAHPRIPYRVVPAVPVRDGDQVCIVELTGGFFRVLHIGSGITLTDTNTLKAAKTYTNVIGNKCKHNTRFREQFEKVSWEKFCRHQNGRSEPNCEWLFRVLDSHSSVEGHVPKAVTKHERYLYPPEPLI